MFYHLPAIIGIVQTHPHRSPIPDHLRRLVQNLTPPLSHGGALPYSVNRELRKFIDLQRRAKMCFLGRFALFIPYNEPEAGRNLGAVKGLREKSHNAVHQIGFDNLFTNFAFSSLNWKSDPTQNKAGFMSLP